MSGFVKSILMTIVISMIAYAIIWNTVGSGVSSMFLAVIALFALMMGALVMGIIIELQRLGWLTWNV